MWKRRDAVAHETTTEHIGSQCVFVCVRINIINILNQSLCACTHAIIISSNAKIRAGGRNTSVYSHSARSLRRSKMSASSLHQLCHIHIPIYVVTRDQTQPVEPSSLRHAHPTCFTRPGISGCAFATLVVWSSGNVVNITSRSGRSVFDTNTRSAFRHAALRLSVPHVRPGSDLAFPHCRPNMTCALKRRFHVEREWRLAGSRQCCVPVGCVFFQRNVCATDWTRALSCVLWNYSESIVTDQAQFYRKFVSP